MSSPGRDSLLIKGARELGLEIAERERETFLVYGRVLMKWNRKINLTSVSSMEDIIKSHFLDSLTAVRFVRGCKRLLDMGTGAGFPGIPLKIVLPTLDVMLMDSIGKKVFFVRHIIRELGLGESTLGNIEAIEARADDPKVTGRLSKAFDCVISRALTSLPDYLALAEPFVADQGVIIAMKGPMGPALSRELSSAESAYPAFSMEVHELQLPFGSGGRTLIVVRAG